MINFVTNLTLPKWLLERFREWESNSGRKQSVSAFARWLGIKQPTVNRWMTGDSNPEGENLRKLARKLGPEVFDVLGLPRLEESDQLDEIPSHLRLRLKKAFREVKDEYEARQITLEDPEAERIAIEILERNGFKYTSTENDD